MPCRVIANRIDRAITPHTCLVHDQLVSLSAEAQPGSEQLFVLVRHAESTANVAQLVDSDPSHSVGLTAKGRDQALRLGGQIANLRLDLAVATRFLRTQETLGLALRGREVPTLIEPDLDEIRAGDFDGGQIDDYRSWKERHEWSDAFPHGESVDDALLRYACALGSLLARSERVILVVLHEFALRQIATAAAADAATRIGNLANATPYLFDHGAVSRAAGRLESLAHSDAPSRARSS
jgi:broad specificity phosphatase PhoE